MVRKSTIAMTVATSVVAIPLNAVLTMVSPMTMTQSWDRTKPELKVIFLFGLPALANSVLASAAAIATDDPRYLLAHAVPVIGVVGGGGLASVLDSPDPVKKAIDMFDQCVG
jgi:hypothetical protein